MNRVALVIFVIALCCFNVSAQATKPQRHFKTFEELDSFLAQQDCEKKLQQWQDWSHQNSPMIQELKAENARLQSDSVDNKAKILFGSMGLGFGLFAAWATFKAIRHWWPISKQRRQLITLLLVAAWLTLAAVIALNDSRLTNHPINLFFSVLVYSVPALAFGAIGVWWFGRNKPEILW